MVEASPLPTHEELPGDLMLRADEAPSPQAARQAHLRAGAALLACGQPELAREQFEAVLGSARGDAVALAQRARCSTAPTSSAAWPPRVLPFARHPVDPPGRGAAGLSPDPGA